MTDEIDAANVLDLATELTVAWLSNPNTKISADELPGVIQKIHGALAGLTSVGAPEEAAPEYIAAVSIKKSLASRDHLISLIDGKPYKMLKRHLSLNGLTPAEYRARYGLKADYPMVAEAYSEKRRALAKNIGLGRKPGQKAPAKAAPAAKTTPVAKTAPIAKASPAKASAAKSSPAAKASPVANTSPVAKAAAAKASPVAKDTAVTKPLRKPAKAKAPAKAPNAAPADAVADA